jgi:hypothetical protein
MILGNEGPGSNTGVRVYQAEWGSRGLLSVEHHLRSPDSERVEILAVAVTPFLHDQVQLRKLVPGSHWQLGIVAEFEAAAARLQAHPATVVLCDRDLPGFDWDDGKS